MGQTLKVENCTKYLGFWLDKSLSINRQIGSVCSQGYMMLKQLWRISSKISRGIRTKLIDSCILSRLNFCNALYFNLPSKELYKLQKVLDVGARFIFNIYGIKRQQCCCFYYAVYCIIILFVFVFIVLFHCNLPNASVLY